MAEKVFDSSPYLTLLEIYYPPLHHFCAALLVQLPSQPITLQFKGLNVSFHPLFKCQWQLI